MVYYWHMDILQLFEPGRTAIENRNLARKWLRDYQRQQLPALRAADVPSSRFCEKITLIAYTFPRDESDFDFIEFAVRKSWECLGRLKAVIVANRMTDALRTFKESAPDIIEIQTEPSLKAGSIDSMSLDCIERLYTRFSTPFCLIIQDDGFPLRDNLDEFLDKFDYIGAPTIRDRPGQSICDLFRLTTLNGGFSLRSRRICRDAARQWKFWKHFIKVGKTPFIEDVFYTKTACRNPLYRLRNRFPSSKAARRFSLPDFDGVVDIRNVEPRPFGVHGPCAAWQLMSKSAQNPAQPLKSPSATALK